MPTISWELVIFYLLIIVFGIQVFYLIGFFSRLAFYRAKEKKQSRQHPLSIIVCARDEDENLARNLPGVLVQAYPSTSEVVVVDDNSLDDTKYILQSLKKTFKQLNVVELSQEAKLIAGKKYPLSIGIREAKHELLLLTDADCVPASEFWSQKMQDGYDDDIEIVLGYGAYHKRSGLLNKLIRFETFHTALQYFSYALAGIAYMGVGRNLSYKKSVFLRNKGFAAINHIPSGDDDLFINRVATKTNTAIVLDQDAFTLSTAKKTWKEWYRQKQRHYSTAKYYKPFHKFLLGTYFFSLILFYPLTVLVFIFYNWQIAIIFLSLRLVIQGYIYYKAMKKLNEKDLWPWFPLFDLWMFFYCIIFAPTLLLKPKKRWN